jgi:hypothetical protein
MWRRLRVALLLLVLFVVAGTTWLDRLRTTDWQRTLYVAIYPLNGDGRESTARYIDGLDGARFAAIEDFFAREARHAGLALARPVSVRLMPPLARLPPLLPVRAGASDVAWWSLRLRWYAWREAGDSLAKIRIFVLYHDPANSPAVPHSLGLRKGLLGVVHAFATTSMDGGNAIVIAHELMHTLGATDKYDLATNQPLYPQGYADPTAEPRHPQARAEIMAGRRAIAPDEAEMPDSLVDVVVGPLTAREIRWAR